MSTDCPFVPSVTLLPCSYPRQSVMSKRNNNTATRSFIISPIFRVSPSQGKLHYQTSHTSDSDKTREISWPVLINYLLGVTLTAQLRSSKQANWGQAGPRRIWFWYPWSLLVRISATTQLFAQSISDLINRQDRQLCTGQPALSFLFTQHSTAQ